MMKVLASPVANANWVKAMLSKRVLHGFVSTAGSPYIYVPTRWSSPSYQTVEPIGSYLTIFQSQNDKSKYNPYADVYYNPKDTNPHMAIIYL